MVDGQLMEECHLMEGYSIHVQLGAVDWKSHFVVQLNRQRIQQMGYLHYKEKVQDCVPSIVSQKPSTL